jgi:TRAP-type mannitol/chloroaromatic compound transport system permease small subunit
MQRWIDGYVRVIDAISGWVGIAAMYLIFAMVGILLLDAVTRNVVEIPLHWGIEAAQFTLASYYFLAGPITLRDNDHARMDLLYDRLSDKGKAWLDFFTSFGMLFFLVILMIGAFSSTQYAIETGERRFSMWNPSMIPIKILMCCCIILMILQTISLIFKNLNTIRGR